MATAVRTAKDGAALGSGGPRRGRPSRRVVLISGAALLVVAVLVVWLLAFSSVFGVRHVDVRGEQTLSSAQIVAAADVPSGRPLLRLDTAAVAARIRKLPEVAAVSVRTHFPSTVEITVSERVAVGVVKRGARWELIDHTGDPYTSVTVRPRGLPLFVLPLGPAHRPVYRAVASVAAQLPRSIRHRVRSVQALDADAITLLMRSGRVVHWGSAAATARKAQLLPALLHRQSDVIDLSDPTQPFTR